MSDHVWIWEISDDSGDGCDIHAVYGTLEAAFLAWMMEQYRPGFPMTLEGFVYQDDAYTLSSKDLDGTTHTFRRHVVQA